MTTIDTLRAALDRWPIKHRHRASSIIRPGSTKPFHRRTGRTHGGAAASLAVAPLRLLSSLSPRRSR